MTREQIEQEIRDKKMPARIESLKASDLAEYMERGRKSNHSMFEVMIEIYHKGVVDGRMWQQNIDEKDEQTRKLLTLKDACQRLEVTYRTTLGYVEKGMLPAQKINGKWRVSEKDLQEFVENR